MFSLYHPIAEKRQTARLRRTGVALASPRPSGPTPFYSDAVGDAAVATVGGLVLLGGGESAEGAVPDLGIDVGVAEGQPELLARGQVVGVATVLAVAERLGIRTALGDDRQGRLALFQVIARVLDQGSRLSAVRGAKTHYGAELLGLRSFDEDDLYANLDWLCEHQKLIEDRLFATRYDTENRPALFLYDVTSSYFEGSENELGHFGYNRDGKKGKKQVVAGLLTGPDGTPLSIELFPGNTGDPATVPAQIAKLRDRFGGGELTLVGGRGMLRGPQRKDLAAEGMHHLTAITNAEIGRLLKQGTIQLDLFDEELAEVAVSERGIRYILRRNPVQAERVAARRADQFATWERELQRRNTYLSEHPKARSKPQSSACVAKPPG